MSAGSKHPGAEMPRDLAAGVEETRRESVFPLRRPRRRKLVVVGSGARVIQVSERCSGWGHVHQDIDCFSLVARRGAYYPYRCSAEEAADGLCVSAVDRVVVGVALARTRLVFRSAVSCFPGRCALSFVFLFSSPFSCSYHLHSIYPHLYWYKK